MEKEQEDELRRKAEEQFHDKIADPDITVDGLTDKNKLKINDNDLQDEEVGAPAKVAP